MARFQVEAIREAYDIPRRDDLRLRDYNTLAKVIAFAHEARPDLARAVAPPVRVGVEAGIARVTTASPTSAWS